MHIPTAHPPSSPPSAGQQFVNTVVDTVTQVTDTVANSAPDQGTISNAVTDISSGGQGGMALAMSICIAVAEAPATLIPTFVAITQATACVGEAVITTGISAGPGILSAMGAKEDAKQLAAIDNLPLTRNVAALGVAMIAVVAAVAASAAKEGTASIGMVAEILEAVGQIVVAIGRMEAESSEKSFESARNGLRLVGQGIRQMLQGAGQRQASKGDDERRARANAANLQMSLRTLAGKLSHFQPKSQTPVEHWGAAAEHFRKLHLATGKLTLVMRRRHGANPRAVQAIAALQRLQGNFHVTRAKLLEAREAALRSQSKQQASLIPGVRR